MLILDDGSDDGTADIAQSIGDGRLRVFRGPHRGIERLDETYNHGLAEARGELIAILEGDDLWLPHKLAIQVPYFLDPSVVLSGGRIQIRTDSGQELVAPVELPEESALLNRPIGSAALAMLRPWVLTFTFALTVITRSKALKEIGGFKKPSYLPLIDYPTFLELALLGEWRFDKDPLGIWRRHDRSTTGSRFAEILSGAYRYAADFVRRAGDRLPCEIEALSQLDYEWRIMQLHRLELAGRMKAGTGHRREAAKYFRRAMTFAPGKKTRLMLKAASALSSAGISPEAVFRKARRGDWREETKIFGDSIVDPKDPPEAYEHYSFRIS